MKIRSFSIFSLLLFFGIASAQKGSLSMSVDKDTLYAGDVIKVEFILDNLTGNFNAPDFKGWSIVGGPATSSSFTMINGEVSQKKTYTYILMPESVGNQEIGQGMVQNENDVITTDPVIIYVSKEDLHKVAPPQGSKTYRYKQENNIKKPVTQKRLMKRI